MSIINLRELNSDQFSVVSHEEMSQINGGEKTVGEVLFDFGVGVLGGITANEIGNGFENVIDAAGEANRKLNGTTTGNFPDAGTTPTTIAPIDAPLSTSDSLQPNPGLQVIP